MIGTRENAFLISTLVPLNYFTQNNFVNKKEINLIVTFICDIKVYFNYITQDIFKKIIKLLFKKQ